MGRQHVVQAKASLEFWRVRHVKRLDRGPAHFQFGALGVWPGDVATVVEVVDGAVCAERDVAEIVVEHCYVDGHRR